MKNNGKPEKLLRKLFSDKISQEELKELNEWYDNVDNNEELFVYSSKDSSKEKVRKRIEDKLLQSIEPGFSNSLTLSKNRYLMNFKFAAVAVIILIISLYGIFEYSKINNVFDDKIEFVEKNTPRGKKSKLTLMDGTKIWLNSESKIKIPKKFNGSTREVFLEGEAFFEVARNEKLPFIVQTNNLITTVLGTSFNIKSYKNESTQLTVATGKVLANPRLEKKSFENELTLIANEQITFNKIDKSISKIIVNAQNIFAWKDGALIFRNTKLSDVRDYLERWYDVDITITNQEIENLILVAEYKNNEKLYNVLESIKYSLGIKYKFEDGRVYLSKK